MVVIDPKKEHIAVEEAKRMKIPVVALAGSDCNLADVEYAIPANDSSVSSINFVLDEIVNAYKTGKSRQKPVEAEVPKIQ